jgi:two-component system, cell cycle sensor histidine kinase and response regulator CckA
MSRHPYHQRAIFLIPLVRATGTLASLVEVARMNSPPPREGLRTILLAEDNRNIRDLLEKTLARAGYRILTAGSGTDVLDVLRNPDRHVDLLITDLTMPGPSGTELLRQAWEARPGLNVICLSGAAQAPDVAEDLIFIPKPFALWALLETVRRVLE